MTLASILEIKKVINSFKPFKALGPDGYHPFFFQKFLNNTLPSIHKLFNDIFIYESIPTVLNQTFIALIPKLPNP